MRREPKLIASELLLLLLLLTITIIIIMTIIITTIAKISYKAKKVENHILKKYISEQQSILNS